MTIRSTTITEAGRRIRGRIISTVVVFIGLVLLVIVASAVDRSTVVDGPNGSSFVTTANGTAAFHELLERTGREPVRLRRAIDEEGLVELGSLVVAEPGLTGYDDAEIAAISDWVDAGGRLVLVGRPPQAVLDALDIDVEWSIEQGGPSPSLFPTGRTVDGPRFGRYPSPNGTLPWLTSADGPAIVVTTRSGGVIAMIGDLGIVANDGIDRADNARVALELTGPGPVGFDEFRHGFSDSDETSILAAAPGRWSAALPLLGVALIAALLTYGRRFGPPEPSERSMIPGREGFLGSLGDLLRRSGDPGTVAGPIRTTARQLLANRTVSDDPDALSHAASAAGLTDREFEAVYSDSADSVYDADRALSKLATPRPGGHP